MDSISNSESFPPSFTTAYMDSKASDNLTVSSQLNLQNTLPLLQAIHDTSAPNAQTQYQLPQQSFQTSVTVAQTSYENPTHPTSAQTSYENPILPVHPTTFFYRPSNDFCHYYISCKEISYNSVGYLLNKYLKENNIQFNKKGCIFYHQQQRSNQLYQVSCEIASPLLINNCLNKHLLGFELQQQNIEQENLEFTLDQKENLEIHLSQYLNNYLLN